jgi:hypothetical protein
MRHNYQVLVANVGTVYSAGNKMVAEATVREYAAQIRKGVGRARFPVVLFMDGEVVWEEER